MRGRKTPAIAFITRLIYTIGRQELTELLERSPLTKAERDLVLEYADGAKYKELAARYHVTTQTIYVRKRNAYKRLHLYIVSKYHEVVIK